MRVPSLLISPPSSWCSRSRSSTPGLAHKMRLAAILLLFVGVALSLKCSPKVLSKTRSHAGLPGSLPRRSVLLATVSLLAVSDVAAASSDSTQFEPAKVCDDECMTARVARKQALLRNQDRRSKADAKVLFGADYQAGKRSAPSGGSSGKIPLLGEFLLPTDVGGVNLGSAQR